MPLPLPSYFVERMKQQLGAEFEAFIEALNGTPPTSLRLNPAKAGASFEGTSPIPWAKDGLYLDERPSFFKDPLIYAGAFYVQEASSMLIGAAADFSKDLRILDLCAAPGGKSTLLAANMSAASTLVSNEIVRNRAQILEENLSRWGNPNVLVTCNHPRDFAGIHNAFDLIVIDAPCSGEGMFRKDPKVIGHWSPKMVQECANRQREILEYVMDALAPGGRLIYSTCTYNPTENEAVIQWLLNEVPGMFRIVPLGLPAEWGLTPGTTEGYSPEMRHTYHCYPHKVKGEGFFLACLEKMAPGKQQVAPPANSKKAKKQHAAAREREGLVAATRKQKEYLGSWLDQPENYAFYLLGETAFAIPIEHEDVLTSAAGQLNTIKIGIKLGEFKRDNLVPDHDLAMSECQSKDIPTSDLDLEQALRFLKRTELHQDHPGWIGWGIVRYKGRNLGWIKALQGRINNHFPKEMRIRSDLGLD
ncbi:MAG: RNA methyltransferase [Bacteroidetes bacterium]|nr:RNA methyltransferase [Bacteroidota bacterium]